MKNIICNNHLLSFCFSFFPSFYLLYFLFKNSGCEEELIAFLSKTDSIKVKDSYKFPTFLLILRIFSDLDCLDLQFNTEDYFGVLIKEEIILGLKSRSLKLSKNQKNPIPIFHY